MRKRIPAGVAHSVRFVALATIERVEKGGAYSNLLLNEMLEKHKLNAKDKSLLTELVYGTLSRRLLLEYQIAPFIKDHKKLAPWVSTLLCLSTYQLQYLDRIPDHAIINEAVKIAKGRGHEGIGKLVNGVLRNFQRNGGADFHAIKDPLKRLSIETSLPEWLVEKFVAEIGEAETRKLGLSLFEPSRVSARVDVNKISRTEAIEMLLDDGIEAEESQVSPYGIVAQRGRLASSRLFQYGLLTVQDESSMLVGQVMQIEPGQQILDACAAPGGKTTHMGMLLKGDGLVTALDIHDHKIKLIRENAERLGVKEVVHAEKLDAREAKNTFTPESFDRILVDAPCSGLGLMRRKPDIKYHKKPQDFLNLPKIQLEILESVQVCLKQNGIMVYSTCTVTPEENQQVVAQFLANHENFEKIDLVVNENVQQYVKDGMLTLYPHTLHTDGFFICCLRKK
jgi:16S rRNA (cytosine967-C5)-methyltransferase